MEASTLSHIVILGGHYKKDKIFKNSWAAWAKVMSKFLDLDSISCRYEWFQLGFS
jgi:hypothetical protein